MDGGEAQSLKLECRHTGYLEICELIVILHKRHALTDVFSNTHGNRRITNTQHIASVQFLSFLSSFPDSSCT